MISNDIITHVFVWLQTFPGRMYYIHLTSIIDVVSDILYDSESNPLILDRQ